MILRPYQTETIKQVYTWMSTNEGNPCIVLPTGSGKSVVIADFCRDALQSWPETRIIMLTHVKELIEQNLEKLLRLWPNAPVGVYSASIGQKILHESITFAGIQSIAGRAEDCGHIDLVIVDECHLISHEDNGQYRTFISDLQKINPNLRVIGFTATHYRLGHGLITDKPALFDDIIEPVTIEYLQINKYLAKLKSKATDLKLSADLGFVHKRGGEYIEAELQKAVNKDDNNDRIVKEVIARAEGRKHWLFFCAGIKHAEDMAETLRQHGITSYCLTGNATKKEREEILERFKSGEIQALTNANLLTTGFDYPDIDLIALCRPTCSPGLYYQMAGRGFRPKSHTDHCLILDFAGIIEMHGPITNLRPPKRKEKGEGIAPAKECPECREIIAAQLKVCPSCGYVFPVEEKELYLRHDDIMGQEPEEMEVTGWRWEEYVGKGSGKNMFRLAYFGGEFDDTIHEYYCVFHDGYAGIRARRQFEAITERCGCSGEWDLNILNQSKPPELIKYKKEGNFNKIIDKIW